MKTEKQLVIQLCGQNKVKCGKKTSCRMLKICLRKSVFWLVVPQFMADRSSYPGATVHSKLGLINVVLLPVLHEHLSRLLLFPDIWHPSAVCFRKRQLWVKFKDQYFILRKKNWPCEFIFIGFWPATLFTSIFSQHGHIRKISGAQMNLEILKTRKYYPNTDEIFIYVDYKNI